MRSKAARMSRFRQYFEMTRHPLTVSGRPKLRLLAPAAIEHKISKTTPCKVAWCRWHGCFERILRKHFDTSGKSGALFHHRAICKTPMALPDNGLFGAIAGKILAHN